MHRLPTGAVHSCGSRDIQHLHGRSPPVARKVDDVSVPSFDEQTQPCPLCNERAIGIDGICATCWLTLAKLEDTNQNVIDVTVRDVFIDQ